MGLLVVRSAGADGRGVSSVLPADDVDLMRVWKHAVAELDVDPSRAALTSFVAWWRADGSLRSLTAQTASADGTLMFITTARPPDSGTITINACAYPVDVTPTSILPESSFVPPPAYDLIDSLSSVGIERLAQETSTIREEGEEQQHPHRRERDHGSGSRGNVSLEAEDSRGVEKTGVYLIVK